MTRMKPLVFGRMENVAGFRLGNAVYFHDGRVDSATFYLDGKELDDPAFDVPDPAALEAAVVPSGRYVTCRAYGAIRFAADYPFAEPTADIVSTLVGFRLPPEIPPDESDRSMQDVVDDVLGVPPRK